MPPVTPLGLEANAVRIGAERQFKILQLSFPIYSYFLVGILLSFGR